MHMNMQTTRHRVLVVEDDPMIRELILTRLDLGGYQTFSAVDGFLGLSALRDVRPAALLLDINMPRLDGFGVLRAMQADRAISHIPTMVLTARNNPEDVRTAIGLGARDFLSKPFKDEQLLARVARLMRQATAASKAA